MSQLKEEESKETSEENIRSLVEKNLELTEKILELTEKLDRYRKWQQFFGILKILMIVIPIILGIIYLPALLEKALEPYRDLLNMSAQSSTGINPGDLLRGLK